MDRERTPDDADKTKERIEADQNEAVLHEGLAENLDLDMGTIKYKDGSRYLGETYCGKHLHKFQNNGACS